MNASVPIKYVISNNNSRFFSCRACNIAHQMTHIAFFKQACKLALPPFGRVGVGAWEGRGMYLQHVFLDHLRHTVIVVRQRNDVGYLLNVARCVGHSHAQAGKLYHSNVVIAVTAGDDFLAIDA